MKFGHLFLSKFHKIKRESKTGFYTIIIKSPCHSKSSRFTNHTRLIMYNNKIEI